VSLTESQPSSVASAWDRYSVAYQNSARLGTDVVSYGPGFGNETEYRLLGSISGKRILDLGCGGGQAAIAMARAGAVAIGVDISLEQLAYARRILEQEENVRVELKHGDLTELAFQRADSVDIVFSAFALQFVPDLNRVFRQVHRVLNNHGLFVFSVPHPFVAMTGAATAVLDRPGQLSLDPEPVALKRSYFDHSPIESQYQDSVFVEYHRSVSDVFTGLIRTGYRVDVILEPSGDGSSTIPQALIVRARKEA